MSKDFGEAREEHLRRLGRALRRYFELHGSKGQEGASCHLEHAHHHPAWSRHQNGHPPLAPVGRCAFGEETQKVHLLTDLNHQRKNYCCRRTKHQRVKAAAA